MERKGRPSVWTPFRGWIWKRRTPNLMGKGESTPFQGVNQSLPFKGQVDLCHEPVQLHPNPRLENLWMSSPKWNDASICIYMYICVYMLNPRCFSAHPLGGRGALQGAAGPGFKRGPRGVGGLQWPSPVRVAEGSPGCQSLLTPGWGFASCLPSGAVGFLIRCWAGVLLQDG